jgi:hypothetical protein
MKLRSKYKNSDGTRDIQNVKLTHGSVFVLGWKTNQRWMHSIRRDKRIDTLKDPDELAFGGERISLTMRVIGTFMNTQTRKLFGQGAAEGEYVNDSEEMLTAFGKENKGMDEWDNIYKGGFHSLNFKELPSEAEKLAESIKNKLK